MLRPDRSDPLHSPLSGDSTKIRRHIRDRDPGALPSAWTGRIQVG